MQYKFRAFGHHNILGTHKATLEFTKDGDLSLKGNCIIGVKADFELEKLKEFIRKANNKKITIIIEASGKKFKEKIIAELNPNFNDGNEIVIRKADFASDRTLAIKAHKAAFDLRRELIGYLRHKKNKINVIIENKEL